MGTPDSIDAEVERLENLSEADGPVRDAAPPSWLKDVDGEAPKAQEPVDNADAADISDGIVGIIKDVHHRAAEASHYQGFEATEGLLDSWRKILKVALKKLPSKDWPLIIAAMALMLAYVGMGMGYLRFRRENRLMAPVRVPEGV